MIRKVVTLSLGVLVALSALAFTSAQQAPDHRFYGTDGNAGDSIGVHANDDALTPLGSATVDDNGEWYVDVPADQAGDVVISINEAPVEADFAEGDRNAGGHTNVSLAAALEKLAMQAEEDAMDDESMDGEDGDAMDDGMEDDSMSDDSMDGDDSMDDGMDSDDSMSDHAYPETGSGGLADSNGVSAGLIGLLLALSAAAIVGVGLRRVRNRA